MTDCPCVEAEGIRGDTAMPQQLQSLLAALGESGVRYCHWKSNWRLESAVELASDLDLLVHQEDARKFDATLLSLGFCAVQLSALESEASTSHFYGLDEDTGDIVHVHAYYRVITGGGLVKRYCLPLSEALLASSRTICAIPVPSPEAELVVFVLRKAVEHGSVLEHPFVRRERPSMLEEFSWLERRANLDESLRVLRQWVPSVPAELFLEAVDCLRRGAPTIRFYRIGRRVMQRLRSFAIRSPLVSLVLGWSRLVREAVRRIGRRSTRSALPRGGLVIAFVGPEASGKSTLLAETGNWLQSFVSVSYAHAGKPPSTCVSLLPNLIVPAMRWLFPKSRINTVEVETSTESAGQHRKASLLYLVRSLLIAYDQRAVLRSAHREARRGGIVLCDRYPSAGLGGMDGPRVDPSSFDAHAPLKRLLATGEQRIYQSIPAPDLVFLLSVPLDVALQRNATRTKRGGPEPEDYVRKRHALIERWSIPGVPVVSVDTNRSLQETQLVVRRAIWRMI